MGHAQKFGRYGNTFVGLLVVVLYCLGGVACTTLRQEGPEAKRAESPADQMQKTPPDAKALRTTDSLLSVQIQDLPEETIIRLGGNGSFQDYQFQRLGDEQFLLNVGDLSGTTARPPLTDISRRVRLRYQDAADNTFKGVQFVGSLKAPLDRYALNNVGNDLVLVLHFSNPKMASSSDDPPARRNGAQSEARSTP